MGGRFERGLAGLSALILDKELVWAMTMSDAKEKSVFLYFFFFPFSALSVVSQRPHDVKP